MPPTNRDIVLKTLTDTDGCTAMEIVRSTGVPERSVRRALADLKEDKCIRKNRTSGVWEPLAKGRKLVAQIAADTVSTPEPEPAPEPVDVVDTDTTVVDPADAEATDLAEMDAAEAVNDALAEQETPEPVEVEDADTVRGDEPEDDVDEPPVRGEDGNA